MQIMKLLSLIDPIVEVKAVLLVDKKKEKRDLELSEQAEVMPEKLAKRVKIQKHLLLEHVRRKEERQNRTWIYVIMML